MPVFKNYDATGKLLNTVTEPLNEKNINRFILEQGEEKAKMYFEALTDITQELKEILKPKDLFGKQTPHMVRSNLNLFVDHKKLLLEKTIFGLSLSSELSKPSP